MNFFVSASFKKNSGTVSEQVAETNVTSSSRVHHTKDCPDADDSGIRVRTRVIHVLQLVAAAKYLPNSIMVPQHQA